MSTCEDPVSVGETFTRTVPTRHYPLSTFSWELVRYRTEFFGTTNQRFTVKASNSIFKPINVGLRCTLFNPLSHPSPLLKQELSVSDTTFKVFILPHFTGLMDRLPYGSGGFLLYQDSADLENYDIPTRQLTTIRSSSELQVQF